MDWKSLAMAVLTPIVGFLLQAFLTLIGYQLDEAVFVALVGAIVTYFVALVFQALGVKAIRSLRG